uniref:Protein distal antenna n=1 Tax=Culicoides sonorensis TaxID=179676 RepID=A0A336LYE8_CULSO
MFNDVMPTSFLVFFLPNMAGENFSSTISQQNIQQDQSKKKYMMAMPMQNLNMSDMNMQNMSMQNMSMPNISMPTPPASKGKRPLRHLSATDKIVAIQRIHDGESKASVARDIGVPESTLRGWCKNEEKLRYMSQQSQENAEKLNNDAMASAMGVDFMNNGPPEKRMKLDSNFFANGKMKYDELQRRASGGMGMDLTDKRGLPGLSMGDYSALTGLNNKTGKDIGLKGYGADMSKSGDTKGDLSMAAISPLTSLSHLSGMSGLGQSPLALSFNDIANNLNLLAQLNNPSLAAMSGLSGIGNSSNSNKGMSSSNRSMKPNPHSPGRPEGGDKSPSLTVKNLAKLQQKASPQMSGMASLMNKYKKSQQQQQQAQQSPGNAPVDDALWYWIKSQQTMLGLNNLYSSLPRSSSPQGSPSPNPQFPNNRSTPITRIPTPPIDPSTQQTPPASSTPEVDTKQTSWFWQWYKNFGASFIPANKPRTSEGNTDYENILYSQLTKNENINNNYESHSSTPKPEDLSQHPDTNSHENPESKPASPLNSEEGNDNSDPSKVKVKEELDNFLYNNNNNINNNNDEKSEQSDQDESVKSCSEALEHGEKFLRWLETCSDPSVTAMQVMQFRLLISCLKNSAERLSASSVTANNGSSEEKPLKIRRRK